MKINETEGERTGRQNIATETRKQQRWLHSKQHASLNYINKLLGRDCFI